MINKNLIFIDSMQFMNSSLEKLVKNLSGHDFKQKDIYPYEYMNSYKRFSEKNYLIKMFLRAFEIWKNW